MTDSGILKMLQTFCSSNEDRLPLLSPFNQEGNTYATNGKVCVVVEGRELASNDPYMRYPKMSAIMTKDIIEDCKKAFQLLPKIPATNDVCPDCDGDGEVLFIYRTVTDNFAHSIAWECPCCDGSGTDPRPSMVLLDSRIFNADILRKIKILPGLKILPRWDLFLTPLAFKFDLGYGAMAAIRAEDIPFINRAPLIKEVPSEQ